MSLYLSQKKLLILLLSSLVLGFLFGALYDFFRLSRRHRRPKKKASRLFDGILVSIEDFLFFVFVGVTAAILFYVTNSGKVRFSSFVLGAFGFALYRVTLSRFFLGFLEWLTARLRDIFSFVGKRILLPPIKLLFGWFAALGKALSLRRRRRKTEKLLEKLRELGKHGYAAGLRRL